MYSKTFICITSTVLLHSRLYIVALHFNENSSREQAVNKRGEPIYSVSYPKGRKGTGIPKEVKVKQTYSE